ncbi:DNF1 [[Candida] subhashii]|uniref:Phospholipid-transporting ATPase n=1 Tax=[Candida] subhashii TaxID=561895 RepID=A0A8J5UZF9_9ASCO|nr:DNF1 [[Candida] subhashii]KAG7663499.1 DNF1 [[Candida] subhashii]
MANGDSNIPKKSPFNGENDIDSIDDDNSSILKSPTVEEFESHYTKFPINNHQQQQQQQYLHPQQQQHRQQQNIDDVFSDEDYDSVPPTPVIGVSRFDRDNRNHTTRNQTNNSNTPPSTATSDAGNNNSGTGKIKSPFLDQNSVAFDDDIFLQKPKSPFMKDAFGFGNNDIAEETDEISNNEDIDASPSATKRLRWGTTRNKHGRPKKENVSRSMTLRRILDPHRRKHGNNSLRLNSFRRPNTHSIDFPERHHHEESDVEETADLETADPKNRREDKRTIVFNRELPSEFIDPESGKPDTDYPRNKIRTTKYTPLSFLPKNIFNQFYHNIANVYFLFIIILGAFEIFGVPSPVLAAVPLIVIVIITAFKDAVEDSRRTVTDLEVNNQFTHILSQIDHNNTTYQYINRNVNDEKISLWRRFKKMNTRLLARFWGASKRNLTKEGRAQKIRERYNRENGIDDMQQARKSFDSDIGEQSPRNSIDANPFSDALRKSFQQNRRESSMHHRRTKTLKFVKKYWKDVKVGDVLRIYNNDEIPADLVILATSDEDNCCYVETKNLDGETNLKVKQALKYSSIEQKINKADDLMDHSFQIDSEGPHPNLYTYQGNLKYSSANGEQELQEPITINNLLLRGCSLRNTKWVVGVVAFTGDDTKIMLNAGITPTKQSRISRELNYYVLLNFLLLFIICFLSGLINGLYYRTTGTSRDFFEFGTIASTPFLNGFVGFFVSLILYQTLVPISLYITIEIIKTAQVFFIYSDIGLYYPKLDFPCTPKSWSISDDLGQIEYIFSDKTGTLTQNLMEFKKCTINGVSYGLAYTEALAGLRKRLGVDVDAEATEQRELIKKDKERMIDKLHQITKNQTYDDEITFVSSEFLDDLTGAKGAEQRACNEHFMLALALCHSVITEQDPKNQRKMLLKAQSPDEAALVGTARSLGFTFKGATKKGLLVDVHGVTKEYQVLNTLEFNSTRKRMSSIIKIPPTTPSGQPKALLICKGADSVIYSRLSKTANDPNLLESTSKHLEEYATEGLRTLCIAIRELNWDQYTAWNQKHQIAASSLDDREAEMEAVADSIERELTLLGGTAIEDRLQDGVPDAISILAEAGIKLWVLTGDKVETAINIGFSCNLLGNEMELLVLKTAYSEEDMNNMDGVNFSPGASEHSIIDTMLTYYLEKYFQMVGSFEEQEAAALDHSPPDERFGVVIDGDALKMALLDPDTKRKFLLLCKKCRAVLCCRVSPAQKAAVVKLVKDTLDVMTLAIGDGSNDVAMIQAADVGVGIAGEEGRQAAMSSDYALGQFRFLARLLLTHGRWSYKRFSEMIPSFFYKNVIFNIALFWYGIYNDFDGTYLFEFTYLMFYNLAFTSLPVIFLGIFDQDIEAKVSLLVPQVYRSGILRTEFNQRKFWWYCGDGIYQSSISFFFPYLMFVVSFANENGKPFDHRFWMGIVVTCIACISCNLFILFHQFRWDWISSLIVGISILIIFIWTGLWTTTTYSGEFYKAAPQVFGAASFWACVFVGVLCCLIPRFFYDFVQKIFWPKDIDIIRECVVRGDFDAYPFDYDPTDPDRVKISAYSNQVVNRMSMSSARNQDNGKREKYNNSNYNSSDERNDCEVSYIETPPTPKPTPPPGQEGDYGSPSKRKNMIFKMLKKGSESTTNSSSLDNSASSVITEEIPMQDFSDNQRRAARISEETRRTSPPYHNNYPPT